MKVDEGSRDSKAREALGMFGQSVVDELKASDECAARWPATRRRDPNWTSKRLCGGPARYQPLASHDCHSMSFGEGLLLSHSDSFTIHAVAIWRWNSLVRTLCRPSPEGALR